MLKPVVVKQAHSMDKSSLVFPSSSTRNGGSGSGGIGNVGRVGALSHMVSIDKLIENKRKILMYYKTSFDLRAEHNESGTIYTYSRQLYNYSKNRK